MVWEIRKVFIKSMHLHRMKNHSFLKNTLRLYEFFHFLVIVSTYRLEQKYRILLFFFQSITGTEVFKNTFLGHYLIEDFLAAKISKRKMLQYWSLFWSPQILRQMLRTYFIILFGKLLGTLKLLIVGFKIFFKKRNSWKRNYLLIQSELA